MARGRWPLGSGLWPLARLACCFCCWPWAFGRRPQIGRLCLHSWPYIELAIVSQIAQEASLVLQRRPQMGGLLLHHWPQIRHATASEVAPYKAGCCFTRDPAEVRYWLRKWEAIDWFTKPGKAGDCSPSGPEKAGCCFTSGSLLLHKWPQIRHTTWVISLEAGYCFTNWGQVTGYSCIRWRALLHKWPQIRHAIASHKYCSRVASTKGGCFASGTSCGH